MAPLRIEIPGLPELLERLQRDEAAAVREALREVRENHIGDFELLLAAHQEAYTPQADGAGMALFRLSVIMSAVERLRRQLGIRKEPDLDRRRELTRERMRRLRERQRAAGV